MTHGTWTLTDVDSDVFVPEHVILHPDTADAKLVHKRVLQGGLRSGVDVVEVDTGRLRFVVVPTRGMGLWRASAGGCELGWQSPVHGPVHPGLVRLHEHAGVGWLDGFDELLCRCGLESNGAPEWDAHGRLMYPLHGRIANIPAHRVSVDVNKGDRVVEVRGTVDEARLFGNKLRLSTTYRARFDTRRIDIVDRVTNLSAGNSELELLYHINIGRPLLTPGARLYGPFQRLAPRDAVSSQHLDDWQVYGPEQVGPETVLFMELAAGEDGWAEVLLAGAGEKQGASIHVNIKQLPLFAVWKNMLPAADGYVTGLEPCINWPHSRSFEKQQGRVAVLAPGETRQFELALELHPASADVAAARRRVEAAAEDVETELHLKPLAGWSP